MAPLIPNQGFTHLASEEQITKTVQALETPGIRTLVVETGEEARTHMRNSSISGRAIRPNRGYLMECNSVFRGPFLSLSCVRWG